VPVPLTEWTELLGREYAAEFVPGGGAAVKIAVAPPERAGAILDEVAQSASAHYLAVARVDASQTRVHMIDQIFFAVARQLDWDALAVHWLRDRFAAQGYALPESGLPSLEECAQARGSRPGDVLAEAQRWINNELLRDYRFSKEFRIAMAMLCQSQINPQNVAPSDADTILKWLRGEKYNVSALKRVQIFGKIARHNARLLLSSLALWLRETGYCGLALLLDINAVTMSVLPGEAPIRYSRGTALDVYEVLRQFIDDTDESSHFLLVAVAGAGLLHDAKRGVDNYTALKMRVVEDVHDRRRSNPLNALVQVR
jgi:hypothetical protein